MGCSPRVSDLPPQQGAEIKIDVARKVELIGLGIWLKKTEVGCSQDSDMSHCKCRDHIFIKIPPTRGKKFFGEEENFFFRCVVFGGILLRCLKSPELRGFQRREGGEAAWVTGGNG